MKNILKKNNEEKKTAIKLLNKYAESYQRLDAENKSLKLDIFDYTTTIKINKSIIEEIFSTNTLDVKSAKIIEKLTEESLVLLGLSKRIKTENDEINSKLTYYEQLTNEELLKYRDSTDCLINKIFILENALIKKDNQIKKLELKNEEIFEKVQPTKKFIEKELYVILPNYLGD